MARWLGVFDPARLKLLHATGQLHLVCSLQFLKGADAGADEDFIGGVRAIGVDGLSEPFADGSQPDVFLL